ncbi:replication protein, partial [Acutalibacter muris]
MSLSKERDAERKRQERARKKAEQAEAEKLKQEPEPDETPEPEGENKLGHRPTIEDAEAAMDNPVLMVDVSATVKRFYGKSQVWAGIMYQDSAPADWEHQLRMLGVPFAVSPLHDQDIREDKTPKKPHWHVILYWPGGSTTYRTAAAIMRDVLKGTIPIPLVSPRGYYRYFTHLDNPNKAQYDEKNIVTGNNFDIGDFITLTAQEKNELKKLVLAEIIKQGMTEYWELVVYAMYNMDNAAFDLI